MKYIIIPLLFLSGCVAYNPHFQSQSKADQNLEERFDRIEYIYATYDVEYINDCLYSEDLICEFEEQ